MLLVLPLKSQEKIDMGGGKYCGKWLEIANIKPVIFYVGILIHCECEWQTSVKNLAMRTLCYRCACDVCLTDTENFQHCPEVHKKGELFLEAWCRGGQHAPQLAKGSSLKEVLFATNWSK